MLVGRVIGGRYRLLRRLGAGGMGEVYEAEQSPLGIRVAVKVVTTDDPSARARFRQEALAMAKLRVSRIVGILDFVEDGVDAFLVMQLLEGETLHALLRRERQLDVARALAIATQMLEALAATHRAGIIHRDVKPSNVFLASGGAAIDVKLIDFGIAKLATDGLVSTTTGSALGTPAYMAPEQLQGMAAVPATDVHAVGVCLFEMLTGRRPWRSTQSGAALAAEILRDEPLSLRELVPAIPPQVDAIVRRAMAKDLAQRYPHASAMLADLVGDALPSTRIIHAEPTGAGPDPNTRTLPITKKPRRLWAVAAGAAALIVGTGSYLYLRDPPIPVMPVPFSPGYAVQEGAKENSRQTLGGVTMSWKIPSPGNGKTPARPTSAGARSKETAPRSVRQRISPRASLSPARTATPASAAPTGTSSMRASGCAAAAAR